ncbi:MAG: exosortase/archaeosortase family protein [Planctomycetes bacterium]|nr:exosortase/archaeosortase family protein [Planctomycetota bacterium]
MKTPFKSKIQTPTSAKQLIAGHWQLIAGCCLLLAVFLWSHWPNIKDLWAMWMASDEFSSGLLVPLLAVYVLWSRRDRLKDVEIRPAVWFGIAAFVFAQFVRMAGTFLMMSSLERFSIVLTIFSLVLLVFGWRLFWKVFSVLLFLFFMLPWPNQVQASITQPLQRWSTESAVFSLEMIGYDVVREGNIIRLGETTVAVAEACNGLRMVTAFFVIIGLVVLLANRPKWEKAIVFATCLPIALLCNTIRLAITSIAFTYLEGDRWETLFHDFGGYAMMPLALAMAVGQLWLLKKLTTAPEEIEQEDVVSKQQRASSKQQRASSKQQRASSK